MNLTKYSLLASFVCIVLVTSGCSSTPTLKSNQIASTTPPPPKPISQVIKEEQKSIAVTDIFYKKEGANLKFVEEVSNKYDSSAFLSSASSQDKFPRNSINPESKEVFSDIQTSAFPIKFTNLADFRPSDHPSIQRQLETRLAQDVMPNPSSNSSAQIITNSQIIKKSGFETKAEYGQLRSFSAAIRGLLIKSGYKVVLANPAVPTVSQGDEYFQVVDRIKAGEFNDADYVMFGVLGEISFSENSDKIVGTKSTSQQISLDLVVDFCLIDTKTYQVIAAFLAEGNGKEVRIDGRTSGFKPSIAKLISQASSSLAQNVAKQLADQNFVTTLVPEPENIRNVKHKVDDNSSTLKIYTK
jgi:hypothetical protein